MKRDWLAKAFMGFAILIGCLCCTGEEKSAAPKESTAEVHSQSNQPQKKELPATSLKSKSLLIAESQFKADEKGQYTIPDAAILMVLSQNQGKWETEMIEDRNSNVFHKALPYGNQGILTAGGNEAMLKLWIKKGANWQAETLWHPNFGGKHNRLRDFELADFNGDGNDDLAVATHDQGVIAVVWNRGDKWEPMELDHKAETFVHEIEIGDLDGDGRLEFYATPSQPNTVSGKDQGGKVVRFSWNGNNFDKSEIISLDTRHIKEILVAEMDGDGRQELYAALEAETDGAELKEPVEIRRFDFKEGKFEASAVTSLNDRFCRFLTAGDIDHDGKKELVAAAFSTGVWVIEKEGDTYNKKCIDTRSGGFEHAAYIVDLEGDGTEELYVADDRNGAIKRYDFENGAWVHKIIFSRAVPGQAMVWNITDANL